MWRVEQSELWQQFLYQEAAPLIFNSGVFLFLFTAFVVIFHFVRRHNRAKVIWLTLFSLFFYYKTCGLFVSLLLLVATSDYLIGRALHRSVRKGARKGWITASILINLGLLAYFKYTNFFAGMVAQFTEQPFTPYAIVLPVGISFFTFQSLSYTLDIYRKRIEPVRRWVDYLFYVSFFPQLVAGPIVRARDFLPQIFRPDFVSRAMIGEGLFLILSGLFKKAVISDYISINFVDRIFDNPLLYSGLENLMGVYGYALQIYCDFSGYSDMAIGIALLLGFRFNINFDSPYKSASITEFWRRWHISLSSWLRDYLYISLGGNRKGKIRTYVNLMLTMLLGGLWHGAALQFVFWGALHGVSLAIHKGVMAIFPSFRPTGAEMSRFRRVPGILLTFHLVCFGWLFFRAKSFGSALEVLSQIIHASDFSLLPQLFSGYKAVFSLILLGYLLHFLPGRLDVRVQSFFAARPLWLQGLVVVAMIVLVMLVKSSQIQPFIYFQF